MQDTLQKQGVAGPYLKNSILRTAKFAGISAVLSIAGTVIAAIVSLSKPKAETAKEGFGNGFNFDFGGSSVFSIVITLAINGLLFYHLYRFSRVSKAAIQNGHNIILSSGLNHLAAYFRILAILFILSTLFMIMASLALVAGPAFK